jgi:hypothetical protein
MLDNPTQVKFTASEIQVVALQNTIRLLSKITHCKIHDTSGAYIASGGSGKYER